MARIIHEFRTPERFVTGTVGGPGDRTFYIQASEGRRLCTVMLEKQQAALLADRLGALLTEVRNRFGTSLPPRPESPSDLDPLALPIDSEFRVGTMGLGWDAEKGAVVVEMLEFTEDEFDERQVLSDAENGPDALRVFLTPLQVQEFTVRTERIVDAGRPECPLCSVPLGAGGHVCVRLNGYRRTPGFRIDDLTVTDLD